MRTELQLGYLEARREPGKTRERTIYTLTDKGRAALREYARTPVRFTPLKSDPLLRLLVCDLVGEAVHGHGLARCVARIIPPSGLPARGG